MPRHAFITVTDHDFFPGTVATVASVRRFAPRADIFIVENDKNPLNDGQAECFQRSPHVELLSSRRFERDGRYINAWELKAYAACDLAAGYDVVVGIDSDCLLCSSVDGEIARCFETGFFIGGQDGDGADYDTSYSVYGFRTPARNPCYMSTSLYFCGVNDGSLETLERWARCCNAAVFNRTGPHPGHGDQGVLNAVIYSENRTHQVQLLDNNLWSQHWVYWDSVMNYHDGRFINVSAGGRVQRAFHSVSGPKFWHREHRERVLSTHPLIAVPYAHFLAMFWFGGLWPERMDPYRCLPASSRHLLEDLVSFLPQIVQVHPSARELWNALPERLVSQLAP